MLCILTIKIIWTKKKWHSDWTACCSLQHTMDHLGFYSRSLLRPPASSLTSNAFPLPCQPERRWGRQAEDFVTGRYGFCDVKRQAQSFKLGPASSCDKVKQCKEVKSEGDTCGVLSACCRGLPQLLPSLVCLLLSFEGRDSLLHFWVLPSLHSEFQDVSHIGYFGQGWGESGVKCVSDRSLMGVVTEQAFS